MNSFTSTWQNKQNHTVLCEPHKITQGPKKGTKRQAKTKLVGGIWHPPLADTAFLGWTYHSEVFPDIIWCIFGQWGLIHEVKLPLYRVVHPGKLGAHQNPSYIRL